MKLNFNTEKQNNVMRRMMCIHLSRMVLQMYKQGRSYIQIAEILGSTPEEVEKFDKEHNG